MRDEDRKECEAFGRTPKNALRISLRTGFHSFTALAEDSTPLAMFGVSAVDVLQGLGTPWFLGRDEVFLYARQLIAEGPDIIADWLKTFKLMENIVSSSNTKAIRLLKRWGAEFGHAPAEWVNGVEFIPFRFRRYNEEPTPA